MSPSPNELTKLSDECGARGFPGIIGSFNEEIGAATDVAEEFG